MKPLGEEFKNTETPFKKLLIPLYRQPEQFLLSLSPLSLLIWNFLKEESLLGKEKANATIVIKKNSKAIKGNKWCEKRNYKIEETGIREKEKKNAVIKKQETATLNTTPQKSVHNLLKWSSQSLSKASKELQQSLLFAEFLSNEIKQTMLSVKTKETLLEEFLV